MISEKIVVLTWFYYVTYIIIVYHKHVCRKVYSGSILFSRKARDEGLPYKIFTDFDINFILGFLVVFYV